MFTKYRYYHYCLNSIMINGVILKVGDPVVIVDSPDTKHNGKSGILNLIFPNRVLKIKFPDMAFPDDSDWFLESQVALAN